jgi:hypothetical protein
MAFTYTEKVDKNHLLRPDPAPNIRIRIWIRNTGAWRHEYMKKTAVQEREIDEEDMSNFYGLYDS